MASQRFALEQRSLPDQVAAHIKRLILSGQLKSGQRIPEATLAEEFGVSRTPIREAVRQLQNYGLVRVKPRSYAEVLGVTVEEAKQIAQVRNQLETLAVRLLAEKADCDDVEALQELAQACKVLGKSSELAEVFQQDSCFHLEIARRSGNACLYDMLQQLDAKVMLCRLTFCRTIDKVLNNLDVHDRIVEAIGNHDPEQAEAIMAEHVLEAD